MPNRRNAVLAGLTAGDSEYERVQGRQAGGSG
jgi:hypothetical protein